MKQTIKLFLTIFLIGSTLSSFAPKGGDVFEIYLDKKLVFREFVHQAKGTQSFQLDKADPEAVLEVFYSHCGLIGKSRSIVIKDANNNILKQFKFSDASGKYMSCKVKDLKGFQKNGRVFVHYSSKELPEGRLLAMVSLVRL